MVINLLTLSLVLFLIKAFLCPNGVTKMMTLRQPKGGKHMESTIDKLLNVGLLSDKLKEKEVANFVSKNCCILINSKNNDSNTTIDCNQVYTPKNNFYA